jgi:large subunit ribosomal protein L10e
MMFRLQIYVSKKWGFTKWDRDEYEEMRASGRLQPDGVNAKYMPEHGPLARWCKIQAELAGL